jgi:hypothetical protein
VTSRFRVAVVSDLHANGRAVRAALQLARLRGFDELVVLGDLLTYGVDIDEVLDAVSEAVSAHGGAVITGNHDQLYFDIAAGRTEYVERLPEWLRESVEFTADRLHIGAFLSRFSWEQERSVGPVLFAHANPFAYPNWRYMNTLADIEEARGVLAARGARAGVFGHNHRAAVHGGAGALTELAISGDVSGLDLREQIVVVNPGSVGQPRRVGGGATLAMLAVDKDVLSVSIEAIDYDVDAHVAALMASAMSPPTREKLASFFAKGSST